MTKTMPNSNIPYIFFVGLPNYKYIAFMQYTVAPYSTISSFLGGRQPASHIPKNKDNPHYRQEVQHYYIVSRPLTTFPYCVLFGINLILKFLQENFSSKTSFYRMDWMTKLFVEIKISERLLKKLHLGYSFVKILIHFI